MTTAQPRWNVPSPAEPERATSDEVVAIAQSRMERARIDLLLDHAYFAAALLAVPMRGTSETAIRQAVVTDGRRIVYRYDLVAALERPRVRLLIMHALAHILLRHPERGGSRNWTAWTKACDIAVDVLFEGLGIPTDHQRSYLQPFGQLSAESIYDRLVERGIPAPNAFTPPEDGMQPPPSQDQGDEGSPSQERRRSEREAFDRALAGADAPSDVQIASLKEEFSRTIEEQAARTRGTHAGNGSAEIDAAGREQVRWQQVLARFMRDMLDREWSFARPNRKHLWRGIYLPGPVEVAGGRFVVAIDTSASMSDRDLALVLTEIDSIRRSCACELTVVQFDAGIHAVAEFSRWSAEDETIGSTSVMRVYGRGGTDLRLPFVWAEEERLNGRSISALIVCTDGYGPLPSQAPADLPVLFLLTPRHQAPSFGELLVLDANQQPVSTAPVATDPAPGGGGPRPTTGGAPAASQAVSPGSCRPRASRGGFTRSYGRMI